MRAYFSKWYDQFALGQDQAAEVLRGMPACPPTKEGYNDGERPRRWWFLLHRFETREA